MKDARLDLRINSKVKKKMRALGISPQLIIDKYISRHKELKHLGESPTERVVRKLIKGRK